MAPRTTHRTLAMAAILCATVLAGCSDAALQGSAVEASPLLIYASTHDADGEKSFMLRVLRGAETLYEAQANVPADKFQALAQLPPFEGAVTVEVEMDGDVHDWKIMPSECPGPEEVLVTISFTRDGPEARIDCNERMDLH